jgi:quercetin dioxygenase-like cupin family protein
MKNIFIGAALVVAAGCAGHRTPVTTAPGIHRTNLQRGALSVPGHEFVQVRIDLDPGAFAPLHKHPGEEVIYVIEGMLEYTVGDNPPRTYKPGEVLIVPPGTLHSARNVGTTNGAELATYIVEIGKPLITFADR